MLYPQAMRLRTPWASIKARLVDLLPPTGATGMDHPEKVGMNPEKDRYKPSCPPEHDVIEVDGFAWLCVTEETLIGKETTVRKDAVTGEDPPSSPELKK